MTRAIYSQLAIAVLCAAGLGACAANTSSSGSDALEGVPEQAAYELSVSDDTASESLAGDDDAIDPAVDQSAQALDELGAALSSDPAPGLAHCREAVSHLNQALRRFMQPIVALVRGMDPTSTVGKVQTWGPLTRGATEFRFILRHGTARHYGWLLQARPAGSSDGFKSVAAGGITVGFAPRRGAGSLGLNLDALAYADPTVLARGTLLAAFKHGPGGSVLGYALRDFTPDPAAADPINALAQDVRLPAGYNRLRLAYRGNLPETSTDAQELVLARVRHKRGVGGRADFVVSGGDIADGKLWVVSECWDKALQSAFRSVRECPGDGIGSDRCTVVHTRGDAAACAALVSDAELPPADASAPMPDPQSPEGDVTPPDSMPDGAAPSGG